MSSNTLFERLKMSSLVGAKGQMFFYLNNIPTQIFDSSVVGNVIQEWLKAFMTEQGIPYESPSNSQEFPDFYMNLEDKTKDLLEVKCFKTSPNFDVANFLAYCRSIVDSPHRLNANYLIFEYAQLEDGIEIKGIWLKKVWEITCASERSALKIQWKQNVAVNIRPANWNAKKTDYPAFKNRRAFVLALKTVLDTNSAGGEWRKNWLKKVEENYLNSIGERL